MTKYRIKKQNGWFNSDFVIEKYIYIPYGPNDYNGMPLYLAHWNWVKCDEYDIPDLYAKLNVD